MYLLLKVLFFFFSEASCDIPASACLEVSTAESSFIGKHVSHDLHQGSLLLLIELREALSVRGLDLGHVLFIAYIRDL